jgi:hypothetical protein
MLVDPEGQQRTQDHIPARTGKAVKVQRSHKNRSLAFLNRK